MFTGLRKPPIPVVELLERTAKEVVEDDCFGIAAQLAYYFILALFPALIVIVSLVSYLPFALLDGLVATIDRVAPGEIVKLVKDQLTELASGRNGGLLTLGVLGAVWTSSSALVSIVSTLNRAYEVTDTRRWWKVRLVAIALTVGLAVFIVGSLVILLIGPLITGFIQSTTAYGSTAATVWSTLQYPLVLALASLGFAIVYYFAPDVDQDWVWITPGSVVGCLLWLLVSLGLKVYVTQFGNYNETYGALGGAAILLIWMYLTGLAILIGGELNAEIEHALPEGEGPGERVPHKRLRLRAFAKQAPTFPARGAATEPGGLDLASSEGMFLRSTRRAIAAIVALTTLGVGCARPEPRSPLVRNRVPITVDKSVVHAFDTDITVRLLDRLELDYFLRDRDIHLQVVDGTVNVTGEVWTPLEKARVSELIRGVAGVVEVDNELDIRPPR